MLCKFDYKKICMPSTAVIDCAQVIAKNNWNIAFIESATAGRMCVEFALSPLSGKILRGGISCYEAFIKEQILHVPHKLIKVYTAESAEVTEALAKSGLKLLNADITVAVTGLTTPGGSETDEKPVGTMFLHIIFPKGSLSHREVYSGTPESIMLQATDTAARLIVEHLKNN